MRMIDPTYLRTIHDGLLLGTLHKDNASALPMGLVGMYEEALPPAKNVNERKKFLEFFAVWALLKKEVSVAFLMALLEGWSEETIIYYINKYSKWFNSPISGKYVLYHERLRVFILQKISKNHFNACNETIIKVSNDALSRRSSDEWENYALGYLSNHMLIPALEKGDGSVLKLLAYNTTHWNRQVEISKGFEWSKRMLNDMMLWASKYDNEEVIECALNKVDLHHQEQNDAPRIVELVAQNDIETALDRIDKFGGQDKEGLQRKFILYMLCLMELTLLDSKEKPFRKEAIGKLLKHFDDNIPANEYDLINWNDFFPSYLMFQMACKLVEMDVDYSLIYKRTSDWEVDWILEHGAYSDLQINILLEGLNSIKNTTTKNKGQKYISNILFIQGNDKEAYKIAKTINDENIKSYALCDLASHMARLGNAVVSTKIIYEAIEIAIKIIDEKKRCLALKDVSIHLSNVGNTDEALEIAQGISMKSEKVSAFVAISKVMYRKGLEVRAHDLLIDSLEIAKEFDEEQNLIASVNISSGFFSQGSNAAAFKLLNEAIKKTHVITNARTRYSVFKEIILELYNQNKHYEAELVIEETIHTINEIKNPLIMVRLLLNLFTELSKKGEKNRQEKLILKAFGIASSINYSPNFKSAVLLELSIGLSTNGLVTDAIKILKEKYGKLNEKLNEKYIALKSIAHQFSLQYKTQDINDIFLDILLINNNMVVESHIILNKIAIHMIKNLEVSKALKIVEDIHDDSYWKNITYQGIAVELVRQFKTDDALEMAYRFGSKYYLESTLYDISVELFKQGKKEEGYTIIMKVLKNARGMSDSKKDNSDNIDLLLKISKTLASEGYKKEANNILEEASSLACLTSDDSYWKNGALREIAACARRVSAEFAKQGDMEFTFELANRIKDQFYKILAFRDIFTEIANQGKYEESVTYAKAISDNTLKCYAFMKISSVMAMFGRVEEAASAMQEALECARGISCVMNFSEEILSFSNDSQKSNALKDISAELAKQGKIVEAASAMQEALECARGISHDLEMSNALKDISAELAKQGKIEEALECARGISNYPAKSNALSNISAELAKLGKIEEALECARDISDENVKCSILKDISIELAIQGNVSLAEKTGLEILLIAKRQSCWKEIGKSIYIEKGYYEAIQTIEKINSSEFKRYFKTSVIEQLDTITITKENLLHVLEDGANEISSIEHVLQMYALNQLFFAEIIEEKVQRLNLTLDIQWAIDIKNSFSASKS